MQHPFVPSLYTQIQLPGIISRQLLNISKEGDSTGLWVIFISAQSSPQWKVFSDFHRKPLLPQFVPLDLSLCISKKSLIPSSLHPPLRFAYMGSFLNFLFSRHNNPSFLCLSSQNFQAHIIFVALHWALSSSSMSLPYWRLQNQTQDSRCGLSGAEGKVNLALPVRNISPCASQDTLNFHCNVQCVAHQVSQVLFCQGDLQQTCPQRWSFSLPMKNSEMQNSLSLSHKKTTVFPFGKSQRSKCMRLQLYTTVIWN